MIVPRAIPGGLNPFLYYLVLIRAYDLLRAQEAQAINYTWAITMSLLSIPLLGQRIRSLQFLAIGLSYLGALGMSDGLAIRSIILPQALRLSIPGWSNEYSIILKDSALAFVLGASEIMARTHFVASRTYKHLPMYLTAAVLYFLLTWAGVAALRALEKRVRIKGYGQ